MPWLTGAGTGTRIARVVMEEEYSVMGAGATGPAGRRGAEGRGGRAARRVPARAGRAAAAASDLREGGRRASRAVAGAGWGEATNLNLGGGGERGLVERTDRPTRGDADEEGGVGHGGAGAGASRHREAAAGATRGAARVAVSKRQLTARLCACEATCAKRAWLTRWGETWPPTSAPCHGAALPRRPRQPPRFERAPAGRGT